MGMQMPTEIFKNPIAYMYRFRFFLRLDFFGKFTTVQKNLYAGKKLRIGDFHSGSTDKEKECHLWELKMQT